MKANRMEKYLEKLNTYEEQREMIQEIHNMCDADNRSALAVLFTPKELDTWYQRQRNYENT